MKKITEFLKTSAIGGLLVLLPLLLLYLITAEILEIIVYLATPIAALFPAGTFEQIEHPILLALALILVVSFVFGLALRVTVLRHIGDWAERSILGRIPAYNVVKNLSRGILGETDEHSLFKPALVKSADGERRLAYLIEDHGDGFATILVPQPPTAFTGELVIVPLERLKLLSVGLREVSAVISRWGVGLHGLLETDTPSEERHM